MDAQKPLPKERSGSLHAINRRGFLGRFIGIIAAFIGVTLSLPLAGYTILPALRKRSEVWVDILDPNQLTPYEPKSIEVVMSTKDGWLKSTTVKSVWAVRKNDAEVTIYSPLCTHLGCGYRWESDKQIFSCPCHGSLFDIEGRVLAGPAPRPLDTLPAKIENGRVWTIYKEFKAGTPKKIEL
jgi:menaquinol-cytochrome c reductase iron-sulfur subunit